MLALENIVFVVAPIIAIAIILYMNFRFRINSNRNMILAVLFGLISVMLVIVSQFIAEYLGLDSLRNIKRSLFYSFVIIAFAAELGKFVVLRYFFLPQKGFTGPLDGIIYATLISLGFSTSAIILLKYDVFGANTDTLYLFIYPVASIVFAIIMGFFIGLGKSRQNRFIDSMTGLFVATFFHGLFNFSFITGDNRLLILFAIGSVLIVVLLSVKALNIKVDDLKEKNSQ